jgi:hypothetical protein
LANSFGRALSGESALLTRSSARIHRSMVKFKLQWGVNHDLQAGIKTIRINPKNIDTYLRSLAEDGLPMWQNLR